MRLLTTAILLVHVFQLSIGFHVPSSQLNPWYQPVHQTYNQGFNPQVYIARKPVPTTTTKTTTTTTTTAQPAIDLLTEELVKQFIYWTGVEEIWMVPFLHICNSTNFLKAVAVDLTHPLQALLAKPWVKDPLGSYTYPELCKSYEKNGIFDGQNAGPVEQIVLPVGKEHFNELNHYKYNFVSMKEMCEFKMYEKVNPPTDDDIEDSFPNDGDVEASLCEGAFMDRVKIYFPLREEELGKFKAYKEGLEKNKTQ